MKNKKGTNYYLAYLLIFFIVFYFSIVEWTYFTLEPPSLNKKYFSSTPPKITTQKKTKNKKKTDKQTKQKKTKTEKWWKKPFQTSPFSMLAFLNSTYQSITLAINLLLVQLLGIFSQRGVILALWTKQKQEQLGNLKIRGNWLTSPKSFFIDNAPVGNTI